MATYFFVSIQMQCCDTFLVFQKVVSNKNATAREITKPFFQPKTDDYCTTLAFIGLGMTFITKFTNPKRPKFNHWTLNRAQQADHSSTEANLDINARLCMETKSGFEKCCLGQHRYGHNDQCIFYKLTVDRRREIIHLQWSNHIFSKQQNVHIQKTN